MEDISQSKKPQQIINWVLIAFAVLIVINALVFHYIGTIIIPLIKALILGIICVLYGSVIQTWFKKKQISLETSFGIGLIATTFYFFILAIFHQLTIFWFYLYAAMALPAGIFLFLKGSPIPANLKLFENKLSIGYLVFLFPFFYAALPSSFYDTLVYHLGIPNLYIQNGGFCVTSQFLYANTSIYYEASLIPSVFAGNFVPRFFHLIVGIILVLCIINFARDYMNIRKGWLLVVLIVTMPLSGFLLTTVKNDLASALFILLGIRSLLEKRFPTAGIFWGFAVGIKYFNALPILIFLVLFLIFQRKFPIKPYFYFSLTFLAALVPLLFKNITYSGNPVFPFLYSMFPSEYWDESRFRMMSRDVGRICRSLKDFIYLPYNLSFKELGSGGRVGVQFLAFLPFMVLPRKEAVPPAKAAHKDTGEKIIVLLLTYSLITIFVGCGFTASIRFFYLPFLLLCIFVGWVYERKPKGFMKILMVIILLLNGASSISLLNYLYNPHLLYTQNLTRDEYITRTFPGYAAVTFLNLHTPKNSKILIVGETRNYYLKRPYKVSSALDYSILKPTLEKASNLIEWLTLLRKDGIDYILVNLPEFYRLNRQYNRLTDFLQEKAVSFFKQLKPIFQEKGVLVFQVK